MEHTNLTRRAFLKGGMAAVGVAALGGTSALFGCASAPEDVGSSSDTVASEQPRRASHFVEDLSGTQVEVPNRLTMIGVIWNPANAMVGLLGQTYKLCATTAAYKNNAWAQYVFPEIAEVPSVIDGTECDVDAIVEIDPCVTLAEASQQADIEAIRATDLGVMDVGCNTFDGMKRALHVIAEAIGDGAESVATKWEALLDESTMHVADALKDVSEDNRPRVVHVVNDQGVLKASGGAGMAAEWIAFAGGRNAIDAGSDAIEVAASDLVELAPDVVIVGGDDATLQVDAMLSAPEWASIPAVMSRRVHANPAGVSAWDGPTPEAVLQVLWAAEQLYPERFDHLDVVSKTRDFYEEFYGFRISKCDAVGIIERKHPDAVPKCDDSAQPNEQEGA